MKDFQEIKEIPYYGITENQNNQTPSESLIPVNQQVNNNGGNAIYKSPENSNICFASILTFIFGILFASVTITSGIYYNEIWVIFLSLIFLIIATVGSVLGSSINFYVEIQVSSTLGTIVIDQKRTFCCFSQKKIIQINELQQVNIQNKKNKFEINFKLSNEREVNGWIKLDNKNNQARRVFDILRNALPQRINFDGDIFT